MGRTRGIPSSRRKLTDEDVLEVRQLRENGLPVSYIARQYNMSRNGIYLCLRGITYRNTRRHPEQKPERTECRS